MAAVGNETLEALFRFRNGIRCCDADAIETVFARGIGQRAPDRGGVGQKSRLA
jgi:hypothetical protein